MSLLDDDDEQRARVLVVEVDGRAFGIPVEQVREVVRRERITRVPGSTALVRGVVNVRGAVVTVLELSVLLGTERAVTSSSIVLLEHGSRLIGLAVDAVRDVRAQENPSDLVLDSSDLSLSHVAHLDAVALCAPHLLTAEEMGR